MKYNPDLRICYDRIVPHDAVTATLVAMRKETVLRGTKATTLREVFRDLDPTKDISAPQAAIIDEKKWPLGSQLRCRFLGGTNTQQSKVIAKAKIWEQFANIHIEFVTTNDEHVRIGFLPGQGSWSAVGIDALVKSQFPVSQPTMNFGWLVDDTADEEYERVVVHEFGHALGCIHEHQSPNEQLDWNVDAVYAQFSGPPNNWSKATIDSNILEKYGPNGITATIFDRDSIMLYQFPAELFNNGIATPLNTHLSTKDKAFIRSMYPKP